MYKKRIAVALGISAIVAFVGSNLLISMFERKVEAKNPFFRVVDIKDDIDDPAEWGKNFPHHYTQYLKTVDQERTKYGGSEAIPHSPKKGDPRTVVAQQKLEEDPRLKAMWAGYAFSKDFREERGHAYMLVDQLYTDRQNVVKQPGACLNCHASTYLPMKKLGNGDIFKGFDIMNKTPYKEAKNSVKHPVACIDCHEPQSMHLRITRPAFITGYKAFKESQGVKNFDVNKQASQIEMRTLVCAQCHVEYFFKGKKEKTLTFPWSNGLKADQILSFYDKVEFKDWVHKDTGANVLKAQHPEFEMWSQGTHAKAGVSCADCHMPYMRVGAMKITDHHIRSPLTNINKSCQTCHKVEETELRDRVENIQNKHHELRNIAMDALMDLIHDLKSIPEIKRNTKEVKEAQNFQRKAQFLLDFAEAENSTGFHAPQEASRIMGMSIDYCRKGQNVLRTASK